MRLRTLAPIVWICLAALWLVAAGHTSAAPVVLGRWSRGMSVVVAAGAFSLAIAAAPASLLVFAPRRFEPKFSRLLGVVRRRAWLALPLAIAPLTVWFVALAYLVNVDLPFAGRAWCGFAAFTALVASWLSMLLFVETASDSVSSLSKKLALAAGSLLLAIVAIEGAGALLGLKPASNNLNPPGLDAPFATGEFTTRVVINRQGLREEASLRAKAPGERRVVFIGDSVTFGWGVESDATFVRRAEAEWNRGLGGEVRAVNAGKPGASLTDYLRVLRDDAPAWQPDWIVIGFLIGNDCPVAPPVSLSSEAAVNEAADRYLRQSSPSPALAIARRSLLLGAIHRGLQALVYVLRMEASAGRRGPLFGEANPLDEATLAAQLPSSEGKRLFAERFASLERSGWIEKGRTWQVNPWLLRSALLDPTGAASALGELEDTREKLRFEWLLCEKLFDAFDEGAREQGASLCILALPSPYQASRPCREFLRDLGCHAPESLAEARTVNQWLAEYCRDRRINFVDATEALSDREGKLFYPWDGHPTSEGHAIIAERLLTALPLNPPQEAELVDE